MKKSRKTSGIAAKKKSNPFEIRFTREKHSVIGRRSKNDVGKPGISRSRAIQKRKATLLQEYKMKNKNNIFLDRRIGEKDPTMRVEDKMMARFMAERLKNHDKKKSIFNLAEDGDITHHGKSLSEIEKFEDPRSDDDDDENDAKLDSKYVDRMHFGGFMDKDDMDFAEGRTNARKEWINAMISESRKRKLQKQKDLQEAVNLTEDLDKKWKEMMPTLRAGGDIYTKKFEEKDTTPPIRTTADPYDILMRELGLEPKKAKASERLKTEEELIKEEKERLEKLERERLQRMKDDLKHENSASTDSEGSEEEEEEDEEMDEEESTDDDKFSDLDEEDEEKEVKEAKKKNQKKKKAEIIEISEIPYALKVPQTYEELLDLFRDHSSENLGIIVSRIIKCNHPQLGEDNKAKLQSLFTFLLQYLHDCASTFDPEEEGPKTLALNHIEALTPYLYDLAQFSPQFCAKNLLEVIMEKYEDYIKVAKSRYPPFEVLIFFKIAFLIFPSSDYRHPVVTPILHFMSQILSTCRILSKSSLAKGLFLSTLFLEAIQLSKRFSPELTNFLTGILYLSIPKTEVIPYIPPFKVVGKEAEFLCFDTPKTKSIIPPHKLKWSDMNDCEEEEEEIDPSFSVTSLNLAISLLSELVDLWSIHSSVVEIFEKPLAFLRKLPTENYHESLQASVSGLIEKIASLNKTKKPVVQTQKKLSILRLYEPQFDDDFDPHHKKRTGSKDKLEMDKLMHKLKREKKGAKKDIRADTAFLAAQKARETKERDLERIRKTREILGDLGGQEGDYRKMLKEKKKRAK